MLDSLVQSVAGHCFDHLPAKRAAVCPETLSAMRRHSLSASREANLPCSPTDWHVVGDREPGAASGSRVRDSACFPDCRVHSGLVPFT